MSYSTEIFDAFVANDKESVMAWLQSGADFTGELGADLLILCAGDGLFELSKTLLEAGASPNASDEDGDFPLQIAVSHGNLDIAELLVAHGARISVLDSIYDSRSDEYREIRARLERAALTTQVDVGSGADGSLGL